MQNLFSKYFGYLVSTSAFMATVLTNYVWAAPGQDAPSHRKPGLPIADGLKGEDHGQVLHNTRDAITGTSSFHDYNLVCANKASLSLDITL